MATLTELGVKYNTDKEHYHHYTDTYDKLFTPKRHLPITLMEIGVHQGASIRMWDEYFDHPDTRIIGVDNCLDYQHLWPQSERIKYYVGDATDWKFAYQLGKQHGRIDFIVDDGSHFPEQITRAFGHFYPLCTDLYCIEDLDQHPECIEHFRRGGLYQGEYKSKLLIVPAHERVAFWENPDA